MGIEQWWKATDNEKPMFGDPRELTKDPTIVFAVRSRAPNFLSRGMARRLKLIRIIECTIITAQCVPASERPAVNAVQGNNSLGTFGLFPLQLCIEIQYIAFWGQA